jgi:Kef-type K+ transport system membrane component KefB
VNVGTLSKVIESDFAQIAAILVMAAVAGGIARLLKQPLIVAYIVVGVIAGPALLGLVSSTDEVKLLAKVGIAILLFLVGLKLDIHLIRSTGVVALLTGVGQVVFTSVVGYFIIIALGFDPLPALYIAVALTFSSTIIIVKLLSDKRELDQLHGRIAVGFLIVQDLLVIVAMIVIVAIGQPDEGPAAGRIVSTFVGGLVFLIVIALLARYVLPRVLEWLAKSQELTLLFGVAWAISLAAISAALGLSMEIGAFVAGVALASTPYRESLGARLVSLRDIMILFFFIELGAALTFTNAAAQIGPALILSAFVLIGNPIIVMVIMGLMGYRKKVSFKAGLAVAQISEFSLILIALGFSLGQVDEAVLGLVTMVGIITITISTYFILYSQQIYDRIAPALSIFERKTAGMGIEQERRAHPYDAIVIGAGRLGSDVVRGLVSRGAELLVVDYDPQALRRIAGAHVDTLYGDVAEPEFAESLPYHETETVVCAVPSPATNIVLLQTLKRIDYDGNICVTALDTRTAELLDEHNDVTIIRPFRMAAESIVSQLSIPVRAEMQFPEPPDEPV